MFTLGERIKAYRLKKGWTQQMLSKESEVRQALISQLESGQKQWTSAEIILKLAKAFGVSMDQLMEGEQYEEKTPAGAAVIGVVTAPDGSADSQ